MDRYRGASIELAPLAPCILVMYFSWNIHLQLVFFKLVERWSIDLNDIRHACIKNKLPFIGQHILDSRNKYKNIIKSHWHIHIKIIQLIGTPQIWVNIYPSKIKTQETSLETEKMLCCMLWLKILASDLCKTI